MTLGQGVQATSAAATSWFYVLHAMEVPQLELVSQGVIKDQLLCLQHHHHAPVQTILLEGKTWGYGHIHLLSFHPAHNH